MFRSKRWLFTLLLPLAPLFAPDSPESLILATRAPASHRPAESDLGPLDASSAIEIVLPTAAPPTEPPATVTTVTSPPTTAAPRPAAVVVPPTTAPPSPDPAPAPETTTAPTTTAAPQPPGNCGGWDSLIALYFPGEVERACRVMMCESRGNPRAENPGSSASGLWQFLDSTWRSTTGTPGPASNYSAETQTAAAARLRNSAGWGQWSCR